MQKENKMKIKL